jgi:hypothetical protein
MTALAGAAVLLVGLGAQRPAEAQRGAMSLKADLVGFEEPPAVSSTGSGEFAARISEDGSSFEYVLSFENLEGTVTQSHIHLGQLSVNGGVSIWLCGTAANPGPAGTPNCGGPNSGGASRVVTATDVVGPSGQGIAPGEFEEILTAMRQGATYANVHSTKHPGGEIRGQIK